MSWCRFHHNNSIYAWSEIIPKENTITNKESMMDITKGQRLPQKSEEIIGGQSL